MRIRLKSVRNTFAIITGTMQKTTNGSKLAGTSRKKRFLCDYIESGSPRSGWPYRDAYIACMLPHLSYVVAAQACYGCLLQRDCPCGRYTKAPHKPAMRIILVIIYLGADKAHSASGPHNEGCASSQVWGTE